MTRSEFIQGIVVRVSIVAVPLTLMVMMSLFDLDVVEIRGWEVRGFSMFAIPAMMHFQAKQLRMDHPILLWIVMLSLFVVAVFQMDVVDNLPVVGSVSILSLFGIVSIQYPMAVWMLAYYQKVVAETEHRIEIKMNGLGLGDGNES